MSVASNTLAPFLPGTEADAFPMAYRLSVYLGCTLAAVIISCMLGKDVTVDTLNYHVYAGFSALNDRFARDYFAAGPESYFNPYAYVPFYVLVKAGVRALTIGCALAVVQSITLWLVFEIALCCCVCESRGVRLRFGLCCVIAALLNPILIDQFGSSFADITTGELVLAGWWLLAKDVRAPRLGWAVYAGLLIGTGSALKLTNAVHGIAALGMLAALPQGWRKKLSHVVAYCVAFACALVVVAAPWAYHLERLFGNPVFPLLNNIFRSPYYPTDPTISYRFIPATWSQALWRPFTIIRPDTMVQIEQRAPDVRYALLVVVAGLLLLLRRLRWFGAIAPLRANGETSSANEAIATRVLVALGGGFALDWALWLKASGNGRYFLPMACVAGVLIMGLLGRLLRSKVRAYVLWAVLACQLLELLTGTDFRSGRAPWGGRWLSVSMPQKLGTEPNLYLTIGMQSNSFLVPFLAHEAGVINFSGHYSLGMDGANGARVQALMARYGTHVRMLLPGKKLYENNSPVGTTRAEVDGALERFSLRVDSDDCATIVVRGLRQSVLKTTRIKGTPLSARRSDVHYFQSCHLVPSQVDRAAYLARLSAADIVLDRLEDSCPALFQPRRLSTDGDGVLWKRIYVNTDLVAWVRDGVVGFDDVVHGEKTNLGSERDWLMGPLRLSCGRRNDGSYFAKTLPSNGAARLDGTSF